MNNLNHTTTTTIGHLLSHGFRPFFLLFGIFAALMVVAWVGALLLGWQLPVGIYLVGWHAHEMLYGLVPTAIAGFLLTAVTNWTPATPVKNLPLAGLVVLWLAGRLALFFSGPLMAAGMPYYLLAAIDIAFLPVIAIYMAATLIKFNNRRNLILVAILLMLTVGNIAMHSGLAHLDTQWIKAGQVLGFDVITVMIVIIAGRITPAFSRNWLKNQIIHNPQRYNHVTPDTVNASGWVNSTAIGSTIALVLLDLIAPNHPIIFYIAGIAAASNLLRLIQWKGWWVLSEPLLWILHLAYLWLVVALAIRCAAGFTVAINDSAWQHLLGVGAVGTIILGVFTRVCLGHTGRPLKLPRFALGIYIAITLAAVFRFAVIMGWLEFRFGLAIAAMMWVVACTLFVIIYAPILFSARADGRV